LFDFYLLLAITTACYAEEGYVINQGQPKLYYQKFGNGSQTIVVPLGFLVGKDFRYLAKGGRTLIFYDLRNRGKSDAVSDPKQIGIQHDVEDLERIRNHFGLEQFSTIGFSYLGKMVVLYALKYPGRVDRIVQLGPVPIKLGTRYPSDATNREEPNPEILQQQEKLKELREQGFQEKHPEEYCEKEWQLIQLQLVGDASHAKRLEQNVCEFSNEWPTHLAKHFEALLPSDQNLVIPRDKLAALQIPVLTIHGTRDRNAPYGGGREWATVLPNARLLTIQKAAHASWADAPEIVFPAMDEFLNGKWPARSEKISD